MLETALSDAEAHAFYIRRGLCAEISARCRMGLNTQLMGAPTVASGG